MMRRIRSLNLIEVRPAALVVAILLVCFTVSLALNFLLFSGAGDDRDTLVRSFIGALVLTLSCGAPVAFFLARTKRDIARLKREHAQALARDSLTSCINGVTFSALVDAYVSMPGAGDEPPKGALVVIDADDFRSVNDQFGFSGGDQALRALGNAIRASVRNGDLVGRLGGQTFGIFLPGASQEDADRVAQRVRKAISGEHFGPAEARWPLTVSGGAVMFEDQIEFDQLFRAADRQLRKAKAKGRGRFEYMAIHRAAPLSSELH
jgi:diguanylate cyclase